MTVGEFFMGVAIVLIPIGAFTLLYEWFRQAANRQQREIDARRGLWQRHMETLSRAGGKKRET